MLNSFLKQFILLIFCLIAYSTFAQKSKLSGKIVDEFNKEMPYAVISIYKSFDTSFITYTLTDKNGEFKIAKLPNNISLRVIVTFSGYEPFRKIILFTNDSVPINMGLIKFIPTSKELTEVTVLSERPPVIFKKDTIEFNANSFKTLPTALVEDLLKKLPGMRVDNNGDIYFSGQKVNRILIDGKQFFGNNVQIATRNLPSNYVDKVQVADDISELTLARDADNFNIGKVINLTLKKSVKKEWFGKIYGGKGTNERYEFGGIVSKLRDTFQVSVIGLNNNVNRSPFSVKDIKQLGGFNRNGFNYSTSASGDGFSLNGISFGGGSDGITSTSAIGVNINHAPSRKIAIYGQFFIGKNNIITETFTNTRFLVADTNISKQETRRSVNDGYSNNINSGITWKPNKFTILNFRGYLSYLKNTGVTPSSILTENSKLGLINFGTGDLYTTSNSIKYNHLLTLSHSFPNHPQRAISLFYSYSNDLNDFSNKTETKNNFFIPINSADIFNQLRYNVFENKIGKTHFLFNEKLSKKTSIDLFSEISWLNKSQEITTYEKPFNGLQYDSLNLQLSNNLNRKQTIWVNRLTLRFSLKNFQLSSGISIKKQWVNNFFSNSSINNSQDQFFNPLVSFRINRKKFAINFSQDLIVPDINLVNPLPDNTNPLFIFKGNIHLQPYKTNIVSIENNIYSIKKQTNISYRIFGSSISNYVINAVDIDLNGIQTNTPMNTDHFLQTGISGSISKQVIKKSNFLFSANAELKAAYSKIPVLFNKIFGDEYGISGNMDLGINLNWNDIIEFSPKFNQYLASSNFSNNLFSTRNIKRNEISMELIVRKPRKIIWETNFLYNKITNLNSNFYFEQIFLNVSVAVLLLKEDKAQIKLSVYDLLNKNTDISQSIIGNAIIFNRSNVLGRYLMLIFNYDLRSLVGADKRPPKPKETILKF